MFNNKEKILYKYEMQKISILRITDIYLEDHKRFMTSKEYVEVFDGKNYLKYA